MNNILGWSNWKIHPFTLFYIGCSFLVGVQKEYLSILFIVCFHELGHYLMAFYYHFDIEKVLVLPFGAFLELNDFGYHQVMEELLVLVAGLSMHLLLLWIPSSEFQYMNRLVFLFNLLPIYPLDGSKILLLLSSYWIDYQQAIVLQVKLSLFCLSIFVVFFYDVSYVIIYGYLFYQVIRYYFHYPTYLQTFFIRRMTSKNALTKKIHVTNKFLRPYHNYYYHKEAIVEENMEHMHINFKS